ncbi:hypothetical protein [Falsiphaeobacter marinintestinus]|uniref:hypothetical protein n=1 Tax=Falsiphaeobacter marinintestinus TaxID=1492905 RepID=UPI0011B5BCBC|nr:hypothetical protein [Phaeobacter marinintestinus]
MSTEDPDSGTSGLPPVFLERQTYRRRRLMDAARLLPLLGVGLFAIPLLWPMSGNSSLTEPVKTSGAAIYLFIAWAGLIAASAWMGKKTQGWIRGDQPPPDAGRAQDHG